MGQMNLKDEKLIAEARALAELLGTSVTEAVRQAVEEKLAREQAGREERRRRKFEALMAISERASRLVPPGVTSDHSDLYDENGVPR
ncbi:type II toxin-antitoxin system VapB family antitoxin [Siccirubricoccus sp. KC 17139]|uniref:Type II toxin-antitoxin system VapB family antitoxin n=1 Tax=Siccirubricoccus soli TaxID=2899147 RepID=A0ABT1D9S7_9PROT|nr:type II toxin-antitoxin system VapB family antitoxin [Siccirubricoccus soli]MCO6418689.1 type II toxin-antitoxin system VapB family antitoxin [Siccirubricoccus soli]MCP2684824.1 type II toxin-antitoxin system VapB family antitoxin [Siccirubricoccus soli]